MLLLVHGFLGSGAAWGDALLDALAARGRVVAVDLLGHGASDQPTDPARYVLSEIVRDLLEVLDALGARRATWIGYSMGGRVALGAAVLHAARVRRLILESASPGLADEAARAARRDEDEARARRLERDGIETFLEWWEQLPVFAGAGDRAAAVAGRLRAVHRANHPAPLAAALRGLGTGAQPSFWDHLRWLDRRTLLLTGRDDAKFTGIAGEMAELLPKARHVAVAGAGHRVHLEQPEAWLDAVRGLLA